MFQIDPIKQLENEFKAFGSLVLEIDPKHYNPLAHFQRDMALVGGIAQREAQKVDHSLHPDNMELLQEIVYHLEDMVVPQFKFMFHQ